MKTDVWLKPFTTSVLEAANAGSTILITAKSAYSLILPSLLHVLNYSCKTVKFNTSTVDRESPSNVIFDVPVSLHVGFFVRILMLLNTENKKVVYFTFM